MYSKPQSAHPAAAQTQVEQRFSNVLESTTSQGQFDKEKRQKRYFSLLCLLCLTFNLPYLTGCNLLPKAEAEAEAQSRPPGADRGGPTAVDVATAQTGILDEPIEYIGTTNAVREVSLRSQTEGRLLNLNADIGDSVKQGQILAQLDDTLLLTAVNQEKAELAALQAEVARARTQVGNAQAKAEQARLELQQAQADAARRRTLRAAGAISQQEAELAQTAEATAQQNLRSATEQIRTEQQAVEAAIGRVAAQQATVAQNQERQSYALLASPINGVVVAQLTEVGNLVTPGSEILKVGDFSSVKVELPVSESELANIRVGQSVTVRLDAFPKETLSGRVTRISPAASALKIPVEVTIPNSTGQIGSGLLARVSFAPNTRARVIVPQTALQENKGDASGRKDQGKPIKAGGEASSPRKSGGGMGGESTLFVIKGEGQQTQVAARKVTVGASANGKVEILSGLQPGERFVTRSAKPLKDSEKVRVSVLSKTPKTQEQR
ncbi:MAG: efflux RND transporter periplasmic adaptor subunit [Cyanobacteriota bacterium]|nr:efflux RND transporter periplasmic adaptor subunit [Cyanobacteriota bacterium]